jgi:basic membrane protein A and related proteins
MPRNFDEAKWARHMPPVDFVAPSPSAASTESENVQRRGASYTTEHPYRIGFAYVGPVNDLGWTSAHNQARCKVEVDFDGRVRTDAFELVSEDFDESFNFFSGLLESDRYDMIVGTSFEYQWAMAELAAVYPNVHFVHVSGFVDGPDNFVVGFARIYQSRYLSGLIAGAMSRTKRLGALQAQPIPESFRGVNSFYAGVRDACEECELFVLLTNSWVDFDLESYDASVLLDEYGVDVIAQDTDTFGPQLEANKRDAFSVGYNMELIEWVSVSVLASSTWRWDTMYAAFIDAAMTGNFAALKHSLPPFGFWGSIADEATDIGRISPLVPADVANVTMEARRRIVDGETDVFCGRWATPWLSEDDEDGCVNDFAMLGAMDSLMPGIVDLGALPVPTTRVDIPDGMRIAMQVLAGVALGLTIASIVLVFVWRKKNAIHLASPIFLVLALIGAAITLATVFILSPAPQTDSLCVAAVWTASLGFSLFIASVLSKTWRIAQIFKHVNDMRVVRITNGQLFAWVSVVMTVDIILLAIMSAVDTPFADEKYDDEDLGTYEYRVTCNYDDAAAITLYVILGWKAALILVACVLAFQTRQVSKVFNESRHLTIGIITCAFVFAILIPLLAVLDDVEGQYLIMSLGIIFGTLVASQAILLPKFIFCMTGRDAQLSPSAVSGTHGGGMAGTTLSGTVSSGTVSSGRG